MPNTAKRLVGPTRLTNAAATVYTVPGSTKAKIYHVHFMNPSAATINVTVSIGTDGATTRVLEAYPVPPGGTYDWYSPGIVLDAAEIMQAFASTTAVVNMTVFGNENTPG